MSFIEHAPHPPQSPMWGMYLGRNPFAEQHQGYMFSMLMLVLDNFILSLGFPSQDNYLPRNRNGYKSFHSMSDPTVIVLIWIFIQIQKRADMASRLIGLSLFNCSPSPVRAKWSVTSHMTFLVSRSQTAQPLGSHLQVLQVTIHSQQVVSLGFVFFFLPLCRGTVGVFYSPSRLGDLS